MISRLSISPSDLAVPCWASCESWATAFATARAHVTLRIVAYTEQQIERIAELGRDPKNWQPADPEAWELGKRMAADIADTYTDDDWRRVLNALSAPRAARKIARRPPGDHRRLLELVVPDRRAEVERFLTVTV